MPVDLNTNEWNSLREQLYSEGVRQDSLEQCLDFEIRRRFGELIARAKGLGQDTKAY